LAEVLQIVNRSVLPTPALASSGADFETIKLDWPLQPRLEMGTVEA